jgi:hypothetical protein
MKRGGEMAKSMWRRRRVMASISNKATRGKLASWRYQPMAYRKRRGSAWRLWQWHQRKKYQYQYRRCANGMGEKWRK